MSRVYITGDKHGDYSSVNRFISFAQPTKDDVLIVLGDNGVNYYGEKKDRRLKKRLSKLPITFFMIRGNHDMRPPLRLYKRKHIKLNRIEGDFLVEDEFPNILFAIDGERYRIDNEDVLVIGGAYSVDKFYRLEMYELGYHQYRWFPDEQLTADERSVIYHSVCAKPPNVILAHTCPLRKQPTEKFLSYVDQGSVDRTMEEWLDEVYSMCPRTDWYCGHWHTDKVDGNVVFLYEGIKTFC